jgi:hypothetical protein
MGAQAARSRQRPALGVSSMHRQAPHSCGHSRDDTTDKQGDAEIGRRLERRPECSRRRTTTPERSCTVPGDTEWLKRQRPAGSTYFVRV